VRRRLIAGNWKMYKTIPEALALVRALRADLEARPAACEVLVAPPFTALAAVAEALRGTPIAVAGQNMHWEREGAFTGEISAAMLKDAGCSHVILGHSERRHVFGEGDEAVAHKLRAASDSGLAAILCVGETLPEREAGRTLEVVERQCRALDRLAPEDVERCVLAYEPVWAIGTGKVASPSQAQEVHRHLRQHVGRSHGAAAADGLRILYGGSVKPENAAGLLAETDIDGALVGGACLQPASFLAIVRSA